MKTNHPTWEEKLTKQLGTDASRFPLPDDHFDSLKQQILANKDKDTPSIIQPKKRLSLWLIALPAAAVLAFFILNRSSVAPETQTKPQLMSEISKGFFEQVFEESPVLDLDKDAIKEIRESSRYEDLQAEVLLEDYLYEEEIDPEDPLANLQAEDIEEYLVENINIYSEL